MLIAGGLSTLIGVAWVLAATGDDPSLDPLALPATAGGIDFVVVQAGLLARRRRLATLPA